VESVLHVEGKSKGNPRAPLKARNLLEEALGRCKAHEADKCLVSVNDRAVLFGTNNRWG